MADTLELRTATVEAVDRELSRDLGGAALDVNEVAVEVERTLELDDVGADDQDDAVEEFVVNTLTDVWHVPRRTEVAVAVCGWKWGEYGGVLVKGLPGAVCKLCWRIRAGKLGACGRA